MRPHHITQEDKPISIRKKKMMSKKDEMLSHGRCIKTVQCSVFEKSISSKKTVKDCEILHPEEVLALTTTLPSWGRKGRRGQSGQYPEIVEAADSLVELSQGSCGGEEGEESRDFEKVKNMTPDPTTPPLLLDKLHSRKVIKTSVVTAEKKRLIKGKNVVSSDYLNDGSFGAINEKREVRLKEDKCLGEMKRKSGVWKNSRSGEETEAKGVTNHEIYEKGGANYKTAKIIYLSDDDDDDDDDDCLIYKCVDCDKCFPTFRALGVHRSIHNKDFYNKMKNSFQSRTNHECQIIGDFDTVEPGNCSLESRAREIGSQSGQNSSKCLEFDLNVLACDDNEDGE